MTPPTWLSHKEVKWEWSKDRENSFQELERRLTIALVLTFSFGFEGFVVYNNTSKKGLRCALMQHGKIIPYTLRQLKPHKVNYLDYDLELTVILFACKFGDIICKGLRFKFLLTLNIWNILCNIRNWIYGRENVWSWLMIMIM